MRPNARDNPTPSAGHRRHGRRSRLRCGVPARQRAPCASRRAAHQDRQPARHQARGDPDAGEPVLRPLLRHAARRARLRRPGRPHAEHREVGVLPARPGEPGRLPAALPPGHPDHQRAGHPVHQPRLDRPARGVEQRRDGQLAARAPGRGRHERPVHDGLLRARGHPVPVRAGRVVHDLRQLPLLGAGPDLAEPAVPHERHDRPGRRARRADHQQRRSQPVHLADLPRGADQRRA